jgi:hypothetical protein
MARLPLLLVLSLAAGGCTATPTVSLPQAGEDPYSTEAGTVPTPAVDPVPSPYPYDVVPVRGIARDALTVVMKVNGAGDPLAGPVGALDQSFCVEVPLPEPADYDIAVTSIAPGAGASEESPVPGHMKLTYDPRAPDQPNVTGCQGERLSR